MFEETVEKLLKQLGAHLSGFIPLPQEELFDIKARLIYVSEEFPVNKVLTLEEEKTNNIWAACGRLPNGNPVFWHKPLPCSDELVEFLCLNQSG